LAEAHALGWDRTRKRAQVLTVHLPSTASPEEEVATVAEMRAARPEHVEIDVARYQDARIRDDTRMAGVKRQFDRNKYLNSPHAERSLRSASMPRGARAVGAVDIRSSGEEVHTQP
jgi:hypothetical protein